MKNSSNDPIEHGHTRAEIDARISRAGKSQSLLRDFVYGSVDGTITTFAIISGVAGAGLPQGVIVTLGIANVLADGFSMAASDYLGTRSEAQNHRLITATEHHHIDHYPEGEVAELRQILRGHGLEGSDLNSATSIITRYRPLWINLMLSGEYALAPIEPRPLIAASATFLAFVCCGAIPLLPFLIGTGSPYIISALATALTFLAIGALKSRWSTESWLKSALQTLLVGGTAATIAYAAGSFVAGTA